MDIEMQIVFLLGCIALGALGAVLGAWVISRTVRAQLEAQREAFELAKEKVQRDLQQTLWCVPQWVQQATRAELEMLGRQHVGRHEELLREQQRWQAAQDERREAQWRAFVGELAGSLVPPAPPPSIDQEDEQAPEAPAAAPITRSTPESPESLEASPPPELADSTEMAYRELTDEEIDALPPDLPPPAPPRSRKKSGPNKPVFRSL